MENANAFLFTKVVLPGEPAKGLHGIVADFKRINVILGANGSGKTRRLKYLQGLATSFGGRTVVYVEGGRSMTIPETFEPDPKAARRYQTLDQARTAHKQKVVSGLTSRVREALVLLYKQSIAADTQYGNTIKNYLKGGQIGPIPIADITPIYKLFALFNKVFPEIVMEIDNDKEKISCLKRGSRYSPAGLSDGEKQCLCLLADVALLSDARSLIIVDEPELNLNPLLACNLWDIIEEELPDSVFIYATHCLAFSMRAAVDHRLVLRGCYELACTSLTARASRMLANTM